jgi:hypothetical protein
MLCQFPGRALTGWKVLRFVRVAEFREGRNRGRGTIAQQNAHILSKTDERKGINAFDALKNDNRFQF